MKCWEFVKKKKQPHEMHIRQWVHTCRVYQEHREEEGDVVKGSGNKLTKCHLQYIQLGEYEAVTYSYSG